MYPTPSLPPPPPPHPSLRQATTEVYIEAALAWDRSKTFARSPFTDRIFRRAEFICIIPRWDTRRDVFFSLMDIREFQVRADDEAGEIAASTGRPMGRWYDKS